MIVKSKNVQTKPFKEVQRGAVFRSDEDLFMKVYLEEDYIACPRCDEDIYAGRELGGLAVHLESGEIDKFDDWENVEIVTGSFIEE